MGKLLPHVVDGPSIYEFVRSNIGPDGRLLDAERDLPDEPPTTPGGIRFAAGAFDGTFGHHFGTEERDQLADALAAELTKAARRPSKRNLRRLYGSLSSNDAALGLVDPAMQRLIDLGPDRNGLHDLGRWLATTAAHSDAVKIGIAVLGVTGLDDGDAVVVRTLGAHEEFTLYAAVAFTNGAPSPDSELWQLAKSTDGWGRIHCVERLQATDNTEIRNWILRDGFRNSVMYEYLAYIAAETGRLVDALNRDQVDRELLTAAGEILEALIDGGPAESIDDYTGGADAVEAYLRHMRGRADQLIDLQAIATIERFLTTDDSWDERASRGWTATRRQTFETTCTEILERPEWEDRIRAALLSTGAELWRADAAAKIRGIDTFDVWFSQLEEDPTGNGWFRAWEQADEARAERLVELARTRLPLDEISTGPDSAIGLGPDWAAHAALDWTLQALRDHTGVGGDLILVGLNSPVVRNRNMSLNAINSWPRDTWPTNAETFISRLAASDPNEQTRELAAEVLGETPQVR